MPIVISTPNILQRLEPRPFGFLLIPHGDSMGLQRSFVVAASRRYVGKETDRRWEQGEDLSLVEFKAVEYQGSKQAVASEEIKEQILKTGIRKLERETRVCHHTIDRILKGENIRRKTLAKMAKLLQGT